MGYVSVISSDREMRSKECTLWSEFVSRAALSAE